MTDTDDTVVACPECGYASPRSRTNTDPRWRCRKCSATFDDPLRRAPVDNPVGDSETDDGLPSALTPSAKKLVRDLRGD